MKKRKYYWRLGQSNALNDLFDMCPERIIITDMAINIE